MNIKQIVMLLGIYYLQTLVVLSQHISKDNYKGAWETPASWNPAWTQPQNDISGFDITINGFITVNSSLAFSGSANNLIVNDTLVITGNLSINNNNRITINDNGILIIRGNLVINNQSSIVTNGYLVVMGNFTKTSSTGQGSFTSNDNPVKVFIGGTISPSGIVSNNANFPVLNCTAPTTIRYAGSGCSYGNLTDIVKDPIYPFFITTCSSASAGSNSPVCSGSAINLTASSGISYIWTGPGGFTSTLQNPSISNAAGNMAGTYTVTVTSTAGCISVTSANITVNPTPTVIINDPAAVCSPSTVDIRTAAVTTGSTAGLTYTYWINSGATTALQTPASATAGTYYIKGTTSAGCYDIKPVKVTVNELPLVSITSDNIPICVNDKKTLTGNPAGGIFNVISGPGSVSGNMLSATGTGNINIEYKYTSICTNTASQTIVVNNLPVAEAGPDQELKYVFETNMGAVLNSAETGAWSLVSGSGQILDINSPATKITDLKIGGNIFKWTVKAGSCESEAEVKITVSDLFIPNAITPNGDGKNDYFKISALTGRVELIIFNRWGSVEYTNDNYQNDWDGRNSKGAELPNDTYMYLIKFESGLTKKGSVLITR